MLIISIGYAACHWCHVMEHESFEDEEVARAMNDRFVSVKVDREERPDIDQVYMAAAYATTGRGGWPLNVIALPDQRPVFAGTYFRKSDWLYILKYYGDLYQSRPDELNYQASQIAGGMKQHFQLPAKSPRDGLPADLLHGIFSTMRRDLDHETGGTTGAPKFPMPVSLSFLMILGEISGNHEASAHVQLTLDNMRNGGIYDHLGGGFCRYSTDDEWHIPHFEKMLYDNAQLISLYAHGYASEKLNNLKEVVEETIAFVERELTSPEGLFYASIDADSEGREGAFYTWTEAQIREYIPEDPALFMDFYGCTASGNWEHGLNVLKRKDAGISDDRLFAYLQHCRRQLLAARETKPRPATDDKILTGWNALMISALTDASLVFYRKDWLDKAIAIAGFYLQNVEKRHGKLWRNAKGGSLAIAGFLDDYSLLIKAFLDLYQATFDDRWLDTAILLTNETFSHFTAAGGTFFNLVSDEEPVVVMNSAELSDNVIPASNSVMARNLYTLGHITGREDFVRRSERMAMAMVPDVLKNPSFHANWAALLAFMAQGPTEVQLAGDRAAEVRKSFSGIFLPAVIWSGGTTGRAAGLKERAVAGKTLIYVCREKSCFPPVESASEALEILRG